MKQCPFILSGKDPRLCPGYKLAHCVLLQKTLFDYELTNERDG